jgi:hypothetical protein
MNVTRDLERVLADMYAEEGSLRAPDRVLMTALTTIEITPQRRVLPFVPWRFQAMNSYAKFAVVAIAVIAVVAVGLAYLSGRGPNVGVGPLASSTASPVAAPSASSPAPTVKAEWGGDFIIPFTYVLPAGVEFDLGANNSTYYEIRVPELADAGHPGGVIVQAIGSGRTDPCDSASGELPIAAGAQAVIDYLKTVPDLTVTDESVATVGDLPAVQARVTAGTDVPTCEDIWPWMEDTEAFTAIPRDLVVRMVAVDVGGSHVVFTIFGEDGNPSWGELADQLIDSFRFETSVPQRSPARL